MGLLERLDNVFSGRDFVVGEGAISRHDRYFGKDPQTWSPAEYGSYIATSNAVYVCSTIRSDLLKSVPIKVYKRKDEEAKRLSRGLIPVDVETVTGGPLVDLLRFVNPFWTFRRLISMTELSLSLWGKGFWFLERGESGTGPPKEIWWARPDRVVVIPDPKTYVKGFAYMPIDGVEPIPFKPSETIWFRYPNPLDEFEGLSPIAAARLAADTGSAAMKSNRNLFAQGLQMGGLIVPKTEGVTLTNEQAEDLEESLDRRFKGVDKAHRWGVLKFDVEMKGASQIGISPKDAEFLGLLNWSLEDVARAYKIPLDFVGGQRTYANVETAERAIWVRAIKPEAEFLSDELTEQLLPMFPGAGDEIKFDLSDVEALQEAEGERWTRSNEQIKGGAITINEWRNSQGLDPVPWGDVYWAPISLVPIDSEEKPSLLGPPDPGEDEGKDDLGIAIGEEAEDEARSFGSDRVIEYGSDAHVIAWRRFERRSTAWEKLITAVFLELMERLQDSILDTLKARTAKRDGEQVTIEPFDMAKWIREFREAIRPVISVVVAESGQAALDDIGVVGEFNVDHIDARSFIEKRAQRFATQIPETLWEKLRESLSEGMSEGASIKELAARVEQVMGDYIASTAETIARTETIGAANGGSLQGYRQSDVVEFKGWLAALDPRTRDSHIAAHSQYSEEPIPLEADFYVGAGAGPAPGQIGLPEEDINCRCTIFPVVGERLAAGSNGRDSQEAGIAGLLERLEGVGK